MDVHTSGRDRLISDQVSPGEANTHTFDESTVKEPPTKLHELPFLGSESENHFIGDGPDDLAWNVHAVFVDQVAELRVLFEEELEHIVESLNAHVHIGEVEGPFDELLRRTGHDNFVHEFGLLSEEVRSGRRVLNRERPREVVAFVEILHVGEYSPHEEEIVEPDECVNVVHQKRLCPLVLLHFLDDFAIIQVLFQEGQMSPAVHVGITQPLRAGQME